MGNAGSNPVSGNKTLEIETAIYYIVVRGKRMKMELIDQLRYMRELMSDLEVEVDKFHRGNMTAGTRARTVLKDIRTHCTDMRTNIIAIRNEVKGRKSSD